MGYLNRGGQDVAFHRSKVLFHEQNRDGWFRIDLRSGWINYAEVLFIKPKQG